MSSMFYSAELWPFAVVYRRKTWGGTSQVQRKLRGIIWKNKIKNEKIRKQTGWKKMEDHHRTKTKMAKSCVTDARICHGAIGREFNGYRRPRRPRKKLPWQAHRESRGSRDKCPGARRLKEELGVNEKFFKLVRKEVEAGRTFFFPAFFPWKILYRLIILKLGRRYRPIIDVSKFQRGF